jgi:hypothetical protein
MHRRPRGIAPDPFGTAPGRVSTSAPPDAALAEAEAQALATRNATANRSQQAS